MAHGAAEDAGFREELFAKRTVVRKDATAASGNAGRNQSVVSDDRELLNIVIHEKEGSSGSSPRASGNVRACLESIMDGSDDPPKKRPTIRRVPRVLADVEANKKCYVPMVVSIGPIHHEKEELKASEKLKRKMTRQFVQSLKSCPIGELYNAVRAKLQEARNCYEEEITKDYDDETFSLMMFIDGCFILQFIDLCLGNVKPEEESKEKEVESLKSHEKAFIRQDLFLLENQLPFVILSTLMTFKFGNVKTLVEGIEWLHSFMLKYFKLPSIDTPAPAHLLDLLRSSLLGHEWRNKEKDKKRRSFRSASELEAKGIFFRRGKEPGLRSIGFKNWMFLARLELPEITVDDSTKPMFLNLMAYEMSPDIPDEPGVTSYIVFMDSLIDHAKDVEVLRSRRILHNYLGSDEDVAKLFNEIATDVVSNMDIYDSMSYCIREYTKRRWNTWIVQGLSDHFSSPWTALAFLAALLALALTVVQTYYAVSPPEDACMNSICQHLKNQQR